MRPFTLVVPSGGNRAGALRALASVAPGERGLVAEAVVVHDGPAPYALPEVEGFPVRAEATGTPAGPAAARNLGAARATAPILVFLDDDVVLAPGALRALERCAQEARAATAWSGTVVPHPSVAPNCYVRFAYAGAAHAPAAGPGAELRPWDFCTSLAAVRSADFAVAGGFDPGFRHPGYEDVELAVRLHARGVALRSCPGALGLHLRQMDRRWFVERCERHGERLQRLLALHPGLRAPGPARVAGVRPLRPLAGAAWRFSQALLPGIERLPAGAGAQALRLAHWVGFICGMPRSGTTPPR